MIRREQIGDCTLYQGDSEVVLQSGLAWAEHIITDPPYEKEAHSKGRRLLGKQRNGERTVEYSALDFEAITEHQRNEISRLSIALCDGWFLSFCQAEAVAKWRDAHEAGGARYRRAMVWIKPDGAPQFTGDRPGMGYESIVASWCGSGKSNWNGGGQHGVLSYPTRENNNPKLHTTQKPIALMRRLLALFTSPGDTILDPFMGSGSTGVACALMNRKFIGIEKDAHYFEVALKRIEEAYKQADLFPAAETEAMPV